MPCDVERDVTLNLHHGNGRASRSSKPRGIVGVRVHLGGTDHMSATKILATTACVVSLAAGAAAQRMHINGAGATFPNVIYSKWFSEYNKLHPDIEINYQ